MTNAACLSNTSDEELLSVILPNTVVKELVAEYGTVPRFLMNLYPDELKFLKGVGPVKAKQLQYICELAKRLYKAKEEFPDSIRSPEDVLARMADMQYLSQEEFRVIFLNTKNCIVGERTITKGTINSTVITPREVFHRAVKLMAAAIILVHNHPSGDPEPSQEDIYLTKAMTEAGKIMSIPVLDHCIVGLGRYISLKERGEIK